MKSWMEKFFFLFIYEVETSIYISYKRQALFSVYEYEVGSYSFNICNILKYEKLIDLCLKTLKST